VFSCFLLGISLVGISLVIQLLPEAAFCKARAFSLLTILPFKPALEKVVRASLETIAQRERCKFVEKPGK
jgi:hypothetical protein